MPAILVGTWSGGSSGETAYTSYTFASDGRFLIRRPGGSITGVAVARSGSLTFYFSGKSVTSSYSVTELPELYGYRSLNLEIGGYSYVREMPGWRVELVHDGLGRHPHTVRTTTPTGHTYVSRAGPVARGLPDTRG